MPPEKMRKANPFEKITWGTRLYIERTLEQAPVPRVQLAKDYIELGGDSGEYQTEIWKKKAQSRTAMALKVKKFKELVEDGVPIKHAAEAVHETIKTLQSKGREAYGKEIQDTLEAYGWVPPDIKREYIRAVQLKILNKALAAAEAAPDDPKMLQLALTASRAVGEDRDVALCESPKLANPQAAQSAISPHLAALIGSGTEEEGK